MAILARDPPGGWFLLTLLRIACRLTLFAACLALLALWVEPHWQPEKRTLELRLREGNEVVAAARELAGRARSAARERELPEVASGTGRGGERRGDGDELTEEDRRLLQRLIEEKLRD